MEVSEVINTQFIFPGLVVSLVLVCAVLVFVFGFKNVEDFPFDKLATVADDRKPAGKKRKLKDKKSQSNGQATLVTETKQKSAGESKQVEKSPPKENVKPEKKQKPDPSPAKVGGALKESTKNIKNVNKSVEESQKQSKAKDSAKPQKEQPNKQQKNKGKENIDVKNKKNLEKTKVKSEEKSKDNDEGGWEEIVSRKDKKSRKPTTSDEENTIEKLVKAELSSPVKKKKVNKVTPEPPAAVADEIPRASTPASTPAAAPEVPEPAKEKPAKKEKEQKKDKKPVEETPVVEKAAPAAVDEGEGKAAKKKKKKATGGKEGSAEAAVAEEKPAAEEPPQKSTETSPAEVAPMESGVVFDELGDQWKEAKTPKKASKKKVRKAE